MSACAGCGATPGALGDCEAVYHALLAAEHADPGLGRWHGPMVAAYLLQHPDRGAVRDRDAQYRLLQLLLDRGLDGFWDFTAGQRRRNTHRLDHGSTFVEALAGYEPLPDGAPPSSYAVTVQALPGPAGDFVGDGHASYDARLLDLVHATLDGLRRVPPGRDRISGRG